MCIWVYLLFYFTLHNGNAMYSVSHIPITWCISIAEYFNNVPWKQHYCPWYQMRFRFTESSPSLSLSLSPNTHTQRHTDTHTHTHTHKAIYTYIFVRVCVNIYTYIYTMLYIYIYVYPSTDNIDMCVWYLKIHIKQKISLILAILSIFYLLRIVHLMM